MDLQDALRCTGFRAVPDVTRSSLFLAVSRHGDPSRMTACLVVPETEPRGPGSGRAWSPRQLLWQMQCVACPGLGFSLPRALRLEWWGRLRQQLLLSSGEKGYCQLI